MGVDLNNIPTWEQLVPHRPGEVDILNGTKTNATPTVPPQNPAAEEYMQMARQIVALGRMVPLARISVSGGVSPVVQQADTVRTDVAGPQITLNRTGAGVVEVTLPSNKFPSSSIRPVATVNGTTPRQISSERITNGARVRTSDDTGTPVDADFTVELF